MRIEVDRLTVRYGPRAALKGATFAVEPGAVYALLGRNGAGKSSLIKVLLGQRRADGGCARIDGRDPWRHRVALMAEIGATPETPDAPPSMRVDRIAAAVAPLYPRWDGVGLGARLERFGIDRRSRFGELSRGQKALVMLALALAHGPALLVLDDPTLGLDPVARRFFYEELVTDLADRRTTILLATHDLDGVERVASHVGVLAAGRLIADGALDEVRGDLPLEERFVALAGTEGGER